MPRDLIFGNGQLLVNLDKHLNVRDIYYPYVGQQNHVCGYRCRIGVWTADVGFSWLGDEWQMELAYAPDSSVSDCSAKLNRLGLTLRIRHGVAPDQNVFYQRLTLTNHWKADRSVRVFFAYDLRIDESDIGDTAFFHPFSGSVIHYKRDRYILASGLIGRDGKSTMSETERGIQRYACGIKEFGGAEGTWRDAEDGLLSGNAIAQGSVDSVIGFDMPLASESSERLDNWLAVGRDLETVTSIHGRMVVGGLGDVMERTHSAARDWNSGEPKGLGKLPSRVSSLFRRSLLIVRAQIDQRGAILASTDSDIMQTARAHYAYVWPRDGALVAHPLDRLGLHDLTGPFYRFCCDALARSPLSSETPDGTVAALMHKYCPDGSLGASWHPWTVLPADREVPIQEDGTALVVWAASQNASLDPTSEWSRELYSRLIRPGARFLMQFRNPKTHLPLPSWDIWEERRGIHLFTTSVVIAALERASNAASVLGDGPSAESFQTAADQTRAALETHFWDESRERFVRTLIVDPQTGDLTKDMTVDSSMYAIFGFGTLPAGHPKVASTMGAIGRALWVKVGIGGLARYENDYYFRMADAGDAKQVPGNPWIICTLWLADWMIATAKSRTELESALDLMEWAAVCALPTGILPEQIHPVTYEPLSVAPLTWSHAQFVTTVLNYLDRWSQLG